MRPEPPLVGRDAELAELKEALSARGELVLVSGEAGIGKSRLVRELARVAEAEDRPVVWGRPEQVTTPGPFALVLDLVESFLRRGPSGETVGEARALTRRLFESYETGVQGTSVPEVAARLRGFLAQVGARPVAIFEDLHLADAASVAVMTQLAHSAADDGHLLVATYRSEEAESLERFLALVAKERLAREIVLTPLNPSAASALAAYVLGLDPGAPEVDHIAKLGEGVPFFIEELAEGRTSQAIPDSIARAVGARLQLLDPVAQRVVVAAALAPGSIDSGVLSDALGLDRAQVSAALGAAARGGLLADREGLLLFRHALVREGVRTELVSVEAEDLHRRLAEATEQRYSSEIEPHAKALSYYWYQSRDLEKAKRFALLAGERALALAATDDARNSFELALACSPKGAVPEALVGLAEADIRDGRSQPVPDLLRRAAAAFRRNGRHGDAARSLARLAWFMSAGQGAGDPISVLDEALDLVPERTDALEHARILALKGDLIVQAGDLADGERLLQRAASIAQRGGDHALRSECLDSLAWSAEHGKRVDAALTHGKEACDEAVVSGRPETIGRTHNNFAQILLHHGRCEEAVELLARARRRLEGSFGSGGVAIIDLTHAIARWRMGDPAHVDRLVARSELGWARWQGHKRFLQAWSSYHLGDRERAVATIDRRWDEIGAGRRDDATQGRELDGETAEAVVADLLVRVDEGDTGCLGMAGALLRFHRGGYPDHHLLATSLAARAAIGSGDAEFARAFLDELRDALQGYDSLYFSGTALELEGMLRSDDPTAAEEAFCEAARAFERCSNLVDRARCLRLAAEAAASGAKQRAVDLLRTSLALAQQAGSRVEGHRAESALRSLGVRPRAGRPRKAAESATALSPREEEVATLVAAGATNAEIAARLYLSERTVQDHITHALRKLGAGSRAGLAAWAAKQGLV
jgi:DNA-binding CsgD family transcriptional regulator/energy-coupling factor transporter ATP-binding protein EcfA2